MGEVLPLPHRGETFLDPRGEGRSIRVSGHRGAATIVLSIWQRGECRATFRLAGAEVDGFVRALLAAAPPAAPDDVLRSVEDLPTGSTDVTTAIVAAPSAPEDPTEVLPPTAGSTDPTQTIAPDGPTVGGDDPTTGATEVPDIESTG
jgi:hypothetical protein